MVFPPESMVDWGQQLTAARTKKEYYVAPYKAGERLGLKIVRTASTDCE